MKKLVIIAVLIVSGCGLLSAQAAGDPRHYQLAKLFEEMAYYRKIYDYINRNPDEVSPSELAKLKERREQLSAQVDVLLEGYSDQEVFSMADTAQNSLNYIIGINEISEDSIEVYEAASEWFKRGRRKREKEVWAMKVVVEVILQLGDDVPITDIRNLSYKGDPDAVDDFLLFIDIDADGTLSALEYQAILQLADFVAGRTTLEPDQSEAFTDLKFLVFNSPKTSNDLVETRKDCLKKIKRARQIMLIYDQIETETWALDCQCDIGDEELIDFYSRQIQRVSTEIKAILADM